MYAYSQILAMVCIECYCPYMLYRLAEMKQFMFGTAKGSPQRLPAAHAVILMAVS